MQFAVGVVLLVFTSFVVGQETVVLSPSTKLSCYQDFLQVTLDICVVVENHQCNTSSAVFQTMMKALNYTHIRIGGTEGDATFYDMANKHNSVPPAPFTRILTGDVWDDFMEGFIKKVGIANVIFGLNAGPSSRNNDGSWNFSLAEQFIQYNTARKYPVTMYEFGNEPNLYLFQFLSFVNGTQFAKDVAQARQLVNKYDSSIGTACCDMSYAPFVGEIGDFFGDFVKAGGLKSVNVSTWHLYPTAAIKNSSIPSWLNPIASTPERLINPWYLNQVSEWGSQFDEDIVSNDPTWQGERWLGETASAALSGQENVSNAFVDSLAYFDKIGQMGQLGQQKMFRQELCSTSNPPYALIASDLTPRPTYFATLLAHRLFGGYNLQAHSSSTTLRSYATTFKENETQIVASIINVQNEEREVSLCVNGTMRFSSTVQLYELTGGNGEKPLESPIMFLNGQPLAVDSNGNSHMLPVPKTLAETSEGCYVVASNQVIPPYSVWLLVLEPKS